jgi:membrane associated rhomboid family serine protease
MSLCGIFRGASANISNLQNEPWACSGSGQCVVVFGAWVTSFVVVVVVVVVVGEPKFMLKHFTYDKRIRRKLSHSYLTSAFSHYDWEHLGSNLSAIYIFGPKLVKSLGCRKFTYLYIAASCVDSILSSILFDNIPADALKRVQNLFG